MEQNMNKEQMGNQRLGSISLALFYKTGEPGLYSLGQRLTEREQDFNINFPAEESLQDEEGLVQ